MIIRFNPSEIMRAAWDNFLQDRINGGSPKMPFSYFLKRAWQGARQERAFWLDGMTIKGGKYAFCFFMEN